jgi:dihydrofolate reductase
MRKIVAGLFVSVDGVVESPDTWTGPYFSPEVGQVVGSLIAGGDTLLLGRVTYQGFAEAFGGQTGGMADQMNSFPKLVVSTTLDRAEWQNSTLLSGDIAGQIGQLKQQPGRNINVSGSATLVAWLLREGLLDELGLLVFPVVVGHGKRLFGGEGSQVGLELTGSQTFSSGVVHLTYHLAGSEGGPAAAPGSGA